MRRDDPRGSGAPIWLVALLGCGAQLPVGWEGAERVADFTQAACDGSPYEGHEERVALTAASGRIEIEVEEARFRCEQDVEAFVRRGLQRVDLLVQPVDMNPASVARCDCLYDLRAVIPDIAGGVWEVEVFRRWDAKNVPNDPVSLGAGDVEVP